MFKLTFRLNNNSSNLEISVSLRSVSVLNLVISVQVHQGLTGYMDPPRYISLEQGSRYIWILQGIYLYNKVQGIYGSSKVYIIITRFKVYMEPPRCISL